MIVYLVILFGKYYWLPAKERKRLRNMPNSLVDWMAQAARETAPGGVETETGHLNTWTYGFNGLGDRPHVFRDGRNGAQGLDHEHGIGLMDLGEGANDRNRN